MLRYRTGLNIAAEMANGASKRGTGARGATIIDVAAHAGVSAMTVSRVINNHESVRPDTRAAVERSIKALSYAPNVAARSLVTSAELRIGVIYSNPSAAFMSEFLTGIFEEASVRGARLILVKGENGHPPSAAKLDKLRDAGLSGVILAPPLGESKQVLAALENMSFPLVAIGAHQSLQALCVRIDDRRAAYEMTQHLLEEGHRRIGFVLGNPDTIATTERHAGFSAACAEVLGVSTLISQGDFSYASGLRAGEELLDAAVPPTAIFASNDDMAAAIVSVAHRRQLDVPRGLTVVGFDDTTAAVTLWPPLTTVHQPLRLLAADAVAALATAGQTGEHRWRNRRDRILKHAIVRRQSTAAPPSSSPA